jgi:hypothetical protein
VNGALDPSFGVTGTGTVTVDAGDIDDARPSSCRSTAGSSLPAARVR